MIPAYRPAQGAAQIPLREALPPEITYEQIRLVVAWMRVNS
jgi:hypothetical protein